MEFPALATLDLSTLRWLRSGTTPPEFRLSAGDQPVLRLVWAKGTGSVAQAEYAGGGWTFARGGFLNPHLTAHTPDGKETARLVVHLNHHAIELAGGPTYRFHRAGVLVPAWKVDGPDGAECLHIEPVREGRTLEGGAVLVAPAATGRPELPLLLGLSWFFIVLAWFEDEAFVPLEDHTVGP